VLLTDRSIYLAGEKIWFKTYLVNARNGKPDLSTKNIFADIVNEKDSVIQQFVLDNSGLHTDGALTLPESISSGFYWIRCYTAQQLAGDRNNIFIQPVYVLNKQLHDEGEYAKQYERKFTHNSDLKPSVHFYAERLTAIPGIISTGVIEIKDGYNNPLLIQGDLVNSKDSVITNFKTNSLGLARLTFVNDPAEKYTVVFDVNDNTVKYELPSVNKNSIQLSVANQTAKTIKAFVTLENNVPADMHTTILAVQHDSLYYAAVGTGNYGITIPTEDFPGSIVNLLLFDENKNLVSERKFYIPRENVELSIKPDKKKYAARENVKVHIKLNGSDGKPLASLLNIAVQDESAGQLSDSMEVNKLPPAGDLLLNNWLNINRTKYTAGDIDLLMATRTSILQPLSDTALNELQNYDDDKKLQHLTGKIVNKKGIGISDRIVTAMAKNIGGFFMDVDTTDKDGVFNLSMPKGFDSLQFSLQVTDKHLRQTFGDSIKIDNFQYPDFSTPTALKQEFLADNINTLALLKKYHIDTVTIFQGKGWLKPVTVTAVKKEELNYDASRRISSISQIITSDKFRYGGYNAIINALLLVPGVNYMNGHISIFGPNTDMHQKITDPLIVMDGVPMPENSIALDQMDPADIDFIEVLRGAEASIYGINGGAGVISINTRHGPDYTNYGNSNLHLIKPVTYHVSPNFVMPDYSNDLIKNSSNPDPRTTIYWNGNITTDANGEAVINFYTADVAANYTITVIGLTANGELVTKHVSISNTGKNK
jgi:hypothetical protein